MFDFILNNLGTILVLAALVAIVTVIVIRIIKAKKKGGYCCSKCGGNCACCGAAKIKPENTKK